MCATTPALWRELATADLLGISLPENVGGSGRALSSWLCFSQKWVGALRRCRSTPPCCSAPTPSPVTATKRSGSGIFPPSSTDHRFSQRDWRSPAAPTPPDRRRRRDATATAGASTARKELVPAAQLAHTILVPASLDDGAVGVFLVDADSDGVEIRPVVTTNGEPHADVILDGAAANRSASRRRPRRSSNRSMRVHLSGCARSNSV